MKLNNFLLKMITINLFINPFISTISFANSNYCEYKEDMILRVVSC